MLIFLALWKQLIMFKKKTFIVHYRGAFLAPSACHFLKKLLEHSYYIFIFISLSDKAGLLPESHINSSTAETGGTAISFGVDWSLLAQSEPLNDKCDFFACLSSQETTCTPTHVGHRCHAPDLSQVTCFHMRPLSSAEHLSVLTRQRPHVRCGGAGGAERGGVRLNLQGSRLLTFGTEFPP